MVGEQQGGVLRGVAEDDALGQRLLQFSNLCLGHFWFRMQLSLHRFFGTPAKGTSRTIANSFK